ncbi:hypothetical protein O181_125021 [Austropuccinia psidii MF-1]|uniref:Uncharacterized protein n=1 Tax=Austropuccinia psidii MF-1 TaxID=1389203 RepID=A0A9Q3Q4N6_9BASI|nr:hypothetical protein [Austropuccinia psidii MF-1]
MTTRRGFQYSIQSDGAELRGRIDSSKGKRKGNIPSGTESTQGSALSQRQVPEMPMISEPELELNIDMSQYKQYYTVYKDKDWEMFPQIHQGVMNSWHILKHFLTEEIVVYSNGWNPLSSKPQIKKIKEYHAKMKEATKESPVASTSKPQVNPLPQEGNKNKKRNLRKPYSPSYRIPKIQKDSIHNVFNMARTLMEFKDKEEQRMRQPHFPKE